MFLFLLLVAFFLLLLQVASAQRLQWLAICLIRWARDFVLPLLAPLAVEMFHRSGFTVHGLRRRQWVDGWSSSPGAYSMSWRCDAG